MSTAMLIFLILYLIIHIILCVVIYLGVRVRFLKFSEQILPMVFFVPVFGMIIALIADYGSRFYHTGTRPFSLTDLALEEGDVRMLHALDNSATEAIVPLEEALLINDAPTRRKQMLNILRSNPDEYIHLLQNARLDEDIDVKHYASTAIMEIQRDHELSLQRAEKEYVQEKNDETRDNYIDILSRYIDSGLINEGILHIYKHNLASLLEEKIRSGNRSAEVYDKAVDTALDLDNLGEAQRYADSMVEIWPGNEKSWLAQLRIARQVNDGPGIKKILSEIRIRNVYLSPEGRSVVNFWEQNS